MKKTDVDNIKQVLLHQLRSYWIDINEQIIIDAIPDALQAIEQNYTGMPNKRFWDGEHVVFSPYMSTQWMNFLYRLSHAIYVKYPSGGVFQQTKYTI